MLKKLFGVFKKKEEPVVEIVEEVEIEVEEETIEEVVEETIEEVKVEEPVVEEEIIEVEEVKSFDAETTFQFEVYVGLDNENNLALMNDEDFETAEQALTFARKCVEEMFNEDESDRVIAFVHGEHTDERGEKILTRYML